MSEYFEPTGFDANIFEPTGFGAKIFKQRYATHEDETWMDVASRIVEYVCENETIHDKEHIFNIIARGRFFPAGRTLHGAGRPGWQGNLVNCYIFKPDDTKESIGTVLSQMYITATCGGGTGYNASNIRPKGANVANHKVAAPGVVSFAKMVDAIGGEVRAGGSRRAAILGAISISHPDVLEWIRVKQQRGLNQQNLGLLSNHNISIYINEEFISAVESDDYWDFTFNGISWPTFLVQRNHDKQDEIVIPALNKQHCLDIANTYYKNSFEDTFEVVRRYPLKARWLWNKIIDSNLKCAEPAILNEQAIRDAYSVEYIEPWVGNNPCTEAVTGHLGNCTLGSLNLSKYVDSNSEFKFTLLADDIQYAVRLLDNVLTINKYPVREQQEAAMKVRRIGLGVMGYGHMLIDMGLKYGSEAAIEFTHKLAAFIRDKAFEASIDLAIEKGPCIATLSQNDRKIYLSHGFTTTLPNDIRERIMKYGIRNAVLLSIAPTGTIGTVAGCSTSIEPVFAPAYNRHYRNGENWDKELVFDPKFKEAFETGGDLNSVIGAYDVTPEEHILTIATWQKYVDQSISKTINCPKGTNIDEFSDILFKYVRQIKGVSSYLEGCRGFEPLEAIRSEEALRLLAKVEGISEHYFIQDCATGVCEL